MDVCAVFYSIVFSRSRWVVRVVFPDLTPFLLSDDPPVQELLLAARFVVLPYLLSWLMEIMFSFLIAGGRVVFSRFRSN